MESRAWSVMFLTCQVVLWMTLTGSSYSESPYGSDNGHTAKKGADKRYGDHDYYDRSRTSNTQTCLDSFEVKPNFIIRTRESLDNEATFIDALKVKTSRTCTEKCCASYGVVGDDGETRVTCDLAVFVDGDNAFENKESNCFLFQCRFDEGDRFRCKFSDHDSYTSSMVGGFGAEPYIEEEKKEEVHEEDEIPQTKPVPLFTKWKEDDKEPTQGNSKVEEEEECNANQFQCDSGECIRLTLLCDDYEDCPDKSDESDSCNTISDENQLAHSTNPPKLHITNPKKQWPKPATTNVPYSEEDDTIFSELAQQLHKEGAKQKMQVDNESGNLERQRGNQYKQQESDWHESRLASEDRTDEIPQNEEDENEHGDDQWQPRQGGRPYVEYDRPRHQDRYEVDNSKSSNEMDNNYRGYPKRPLDDSNDDTTENDNRGGDSDRDGNRSKEQDRYVDGNSRYRPQQTELDSNRYGKKQNDKEYDENMDQVSSNHEDESKSEHSQERSQQDYNSKANKDKLDSHNKDDSDTPNPSDQRQQEVSNSKLKGESIKEDWYGQHQKQPDEDDPRNKVPVGGGHGFPGSKENEDYNKNDYQDYFNYYDRNPVRGNPNRYPYNYRNMYGQGDYQDFQDYSRQGNNQGRGKSGPGGRGRGNNHNWPPVKSRYGAEDSGEDQRADEDNDDDASQNEMDIPKDKIQGDAHEQGHPNSADVPHSRRLRPGLWKIWRYMYGSSTPDYTTQYPHDTDNSNNRVEEEGAETEDKNDADEMDNGIKDEHQDITNKLPMKIPSTSNTWVSDPVNRDTTSKPLQTHKPNVVPDPASPPDQSNNSKNIEDNKLTRTTTASEQHKVRAAGKQTVTATAVLPLTIGLFLTMFLLLMMSCRLRYMNRRLRYGRLKTNNVHDADYLINGMYL